MLNIIKTRKVWFSLSGIIVGFSIFSIFFWGLNFGIDFTGGSLLEVEFEKDRPAISELSKSLEELSLSSLIIQSIGDKGVILRFQETSEEKHQDILNKLKILVKTDDNNEQGKISASSTIDQINASTSLEKANLKNSGLIEMRYDSVGPVIGKELKEKSLYASIIVLISIIIFIAYAFRHVSRPIESWKYGVAAVIALFHDVIITIGVFSVLGEFYNVEINTSFVAAILTVLGYSVNDTIVVFDRIRENLPKSDDDFETTVNNSINQTIIRSINTSLTVLLSLLAIYLFGGESIKFFALALLIGISVGTYSSIFLASPVLVIWEKMKK